ncbi:hypothetical protein EV424DRAFT_1351905 [Suillus variegatus]|nr:hypothetical protein EV424DRAFT_1351905 [Suillus variegatus]
MQQLIQVPDIPTVVIHHTRHLPWVLVLVVHDDTPMVPPPAPARELHGCSVAILRLGAFTARARGACRVDSRWGVGGIRAAKLNSIVVPPLHPLIHCAHPLVHPAHPLAPLRPPPSHTSRAPSRTSCAPLSWLQSTLAPANNGTLNSFVRRSGRAVKPTEKICETLVASSTSAKRSAPEPPQGVPAPKRVFVSQEDDYDDNEDAPALEDVTE